MSVTLYSYVVARDFGFAPNPFYGVCTLATCKPIVRRVAKIGDWVIGTGSKEYDSIGHLVFAMRISEILTFSDYWKDPRFQHKKPNMRGSWKQAFGDNIYHRTTTAGAWIQENSHHSYEGGAPNPENIEHDTRTPKVLVAGAEFVYWGGKAPIIPVELRKVCAVRGHKSRFPEEFVSRFLSWIKSLDASGYMGDPSEFGRPKT
jgi:hypothetical protein